MYPCSWKSVGASCKYPEVSEIPESGGGEEQNKETAFFCPMCLPYLRACMKEELTPWTFFQVMLKARHTGSEITKDLQDLDATTEIYHQPVCSA